MKRMVRFLCPYWKPEWHGEWGFVWFDRQWFGWLHPTRFYDTKRPPLRWWIYAAITKHGYAKDQTMLSLGLLGLRWHRSWFRKSNAEAHGRRSRTVQPLVGSLNQEGKA